MFSYDAAHFIIRVQAWACSRENDVTVSIEEEPKQLLCCCNYQLVMHQSYATMSLKRQGIAGA